MIKPREFLNHLEKECMKVTGIKSYPITMEQYREWIDKRDEIIDVLVGAATKLREAQKTYLADRETTGKTNNDLGKLVGIAADELDYALARAKAMRGE